MNIAIFLPKKAYLFCRFKKFPGQNFQGRKLWHWWWNAALENLGKMSDCNCVALYVWNCAPVPVHLLIISASFAKMIIAVGNTESKMCLRDSQIFRSTDGTLVASF